METPKHSLNTIQNFKFGTPAKSMETNSVSKVRVIVRVRPFLPQEILSKDGNLKSCISVLDQNFGPCDEVAVHLSDPHTSRNECYRVDSFFDQKDDNVSQIFSREVDPLIPGIFHGCNATVFAYGATGSGKTYTMQGTDELPGLMPLVMSAVLSLCKKMGSTAEISYYEVYMDRCYDLLEVKAKEIVIRDDKDGQIHLSGLSRVPVLSMSEFNEVFSCAVQRRKVAHTGLNDVSSRSHGVLVISVSSLTGDASGAVVTGKINLIDLAGNEDNRRTCNEGIRLQESSKINQSLFALSNVIYALNNNKPRVPYRESKLTRILQDSLGGTSCALMVACLLSNSEVNTMDSQLEGLHLAADNHIEETNADTKDLGLESATHLRGHSAGVQKMEFTDSTNSAGSLKERENALESPQRKALSPVNSNVNPQPLEQLSSPKTPFLSSLGKNNSQTTVTPVDNKFCTWSNSLKNCVVQEYIHFLNTASKEELVELKGIGWKMAESICEVRETSPIKKLKDLEKIGLSWKQVHNMFGKAARGIFDTAQPSKEYLVL
ncbi:kinesin-like protein KIN-10B [Carica papaya]|uniref:kinesin-like protein KIN-10B n=1 Tax=Carica papaya TaxID=3649 RepID=UPI000B8D0F77|nr:kinesin-like protein KIN-10B [Carica papaya]